MNNLFFKNFSQNLLEQDFSRIDIKIDKIEISCFFKLLGNNLYFLAPLHIDNTEFAAIFDFVKDIVKANFKFDVINKIFFLEILIADDINEDLIKYVTHNCNFEDKIINIKWLVDTKDLNIICNGNQPTKLLNITNIIKSSFDNNKNNKNDKNIYNFKYKNGNTSFTLATIFILICVHIFSIAIDYHDSLINAFCISPYMFKDKEYYRIFTAMFFHLNFYHLISNVLSLYIFGSRLEKYLGKVNYVATYTFGIILSGLFSFFINKDAYSIGASGAIFALEGFLLYYSFKYKKIFAGLDFFVFIQFAVINILFGFLYPNIDNAGHIGGFLAGIIAGAILSLFH